MMPSFAKKPTAIASKSVGDAIKVASSSPFTEMQICASSTTQATTSLGSPAPTAMYSTGLIPVAFSMRGRVLPLLVT